MLRQRNECCNIMVIRRQNFVATMDFCVATLIEKFLKKDVAILFCSIATMIKQSRVLSQQSNLCHDIKSFRVKNICHDKIKLCRDRKWKSNEISQDKLVATKISMLQQTV